MQTEQLMTIANDTLACIEIFNASASLQKIAQNYGLDLMRAELTKNTLNDVSSINCSVDRVTLNQLFEMVAAQWKTMGETKPHWSVLSSEEWLPENLNLEKLEEFYSSGNDDVELLESVIKQANVVLPSNALCMELGCGVGRVTQHLAKKFAHVTAVDISRGNLEICRQRMLDQGAANVTPIILNHPENIGALAHCDIFFSRIVLQHNPPPIQIEFLDKISANMKPGGVMYFQMITAGKNYSYNAADHLANWQKQNFEMHALPIPFITKTLSQNGYRVAHVVRDLAGGYGVDSFTFLAVPI